MEGNTTPLESRILQILEPVTALSAPSDFVSEQTPSAHGVSAEVLSNQELDFEIKKREQLLRQKDQELDFEIKKREQLLHQKDQELLQQREEHQLRKRVLFYIFRFVVVFVVSVMVCLYWCAFGWAKLSDNVLMVLLGTTTVDLVGLLYIALKWLFPNRSIAGN